MKTIVVNEGNDIPETVNLCMLKLDMSEHCDQEWTQGKRKDGQLCGYHPDQYDWYDEPFDMDRVVAWIDLEGV